MTGIELSHLRYFLALAEELHFGRAAARLHMAQPPLTRHIRLLESRLQCRLFDRTTRSTRLTPAGELFVARARAILAEADNAFQSMQSLGRGEAGQLTVAAAPSLMLGELPRLIRAFRKRFPAVEFRLSEMATSAILQAVRLGTADLGFVRGLDKDASIRTHWRWREPMFAILPHGHPEAASSSLSIAALRAEPFVFFPRQLGPAFHDEVMAYCRRAGFSPSIVQEARQWSSVIGLVNAGIGVSVGPQSVTALLPKAVRCVPLHNVTTNVRIVGSPTGDANPTVANFLRLAEKRYLDPHPPA
ncbi:MAG TPA: LysR family transcriptional regulator [Bryobacteraceae bacterium]|nr:LysR family transcriptional regulator [Bryobacteraceae bacterium]